MPSQINEKPLSPKIGAEPWMALAKNFSMTNKDNNRDDVAITGNPLNHSSTIKTICEQEYKSHDTKSIVLGNKF